MEKKEKEIIRKRKVASFTLSDEVKEMIKDIAEEKCISRSAVVSMAVVDFFNKMKK